MADDVVALARRFEPFLVMHSGEQSLPSDAKRYMEHCALWKAERPFDQKDSWGGKGQPFKRAPMIGKGRIAPSNAPGEVGPADIFLGTKEKSAFPFLADNGEQHFLELTGWKDSVDVTSTSENRYTDRQKVEALYRSDDDLRNSQLYYHAELYTTERLRVLFARFSESLATPDLGAVFAELAPRNPALLCYYFFFPTHDEALPPPCDTTDSGMEVSSYVGEWACMAILLERESATAPFQPKFIGRTGRFNAGTGQGLDADRRVGMTVTKWQVKTDVHEELLPHTVEGHAVLYVSVGVHSLHLQPGAHEVDPYLPESTPVACGQFDSPDALKEYQDSLPSTEEEGSPAAAWAKIVAGLFLGGLPGLVGGAIATALEGLPLGSGFSGVATGSGPPAKPAIDVGAAASDPFSPQIIGPKDLNLKDFGLFPGANSLSWNNSRNDKVGSRHYDFIVDRSKQVWWPSDDGKSGYRGRWGPLVVDDPFHRRAGMRFPEFWKMFFIGLAKSR